METADYYRKLGKIIISRERIQAKVRELAERISRDFQGEELILICNLKGSFRLLADLVSYLTIPAVIDFVSFRSYDGLASRGKIHIAKDLDIDVAGKSILIVEDIVDAGATLDYVINYFQKFKKPKDIKVCALLDKPSRRKADVPIHYRGFEIPDLFIVGYGLDYNEHFRELNDIREYEE